MQLKIEREALKKEDDPAARERLGKLEKELADLEQQSAALTAQWQAEKGKHAEAQKLKEQLDHARTELEQATRRGDFNRAGELTYSVIPELEQGLAKAQEEQSQRMVHEEVTDSDIAQVVSRWTGIPVDKMLEGERDKLLQMEDKLHTRVVGQDEAVVAVSNAVRRARRSAGPEPAARLVPVPRADGRRQDRVVQGARRVPVRRRAGDDPHRHVGVHGEAHGRPPDRGAARLRRLRGGGALTEAVRRRPYQVILFDEVEKAHNDVFNVLLQVLDDGRLTDSHGRTVDFKNTLIVLTSNLGSEYLASLGPGQSVNEVREQVMAVVRASFRPEFLNRLDEIILFERLSREHMKGIVEIQLKRLEGLLAERKIALDITDAAKRWLADAGYDPVYGARPLKRTIQRSLQDPLARMILEGRIGDGDRERRCRRERS